MSVRYTVTATVRDEAVLEEYTQWLQGGHMAAVLAGGARSAEICILESDSSAAPRLEASYVFDSREALQAYFDGPAVALRQEGVQLWVQTQKVTFERRIGRLTYSI